MQLQIQTSSSELFSISDFKYLYELARCSKCQMFTVLKSTNKMYGADEGQFPIHEIDIPFLVNTDLVFRTDLAYKEIMNTYNNFFVPDKFHHIIIPVEYWNNYISNNLDQRYIPELDKFEVFDKITNQAIPQLYMFKNRLDYYRRDFDIMLEGFFMRQHTLLPPITLSQIQNDTILQEVRDGKTSNGAKLCELDLNGIPIRFFFYKSLFSLAKSDTLDVDIRFDAFNSNIYMMTFKPKKKKNPLNITTYGVPFSERIHTMNFLI